MPRVATLAPQPGPPARQYSFTDWQVNNPTAPPPGNQLDGEFDRSNAAITQTQTWAATSLNTDGTIKAATVGQTQLVSGLFDFIASDAIAQVQPLVDEAEQAATTATTSANDAQTSAVFSGQQAVLSQGAATSAQASVTTAQTAANNANASANRGDASATASSNSANSSLQSQNLCTEYGVLTQAWAEHMPDTIPPNILATMGVTGDHWSSRWWANQAHLIVQADVAQALCDLQTYWMGAYANNPTLTTCGDPIVAGAAYFNTTVSRTRVFDGTNWHDLVEPIPGRLVDYVYLPTTPTTTFTGPDSNAHTLVLDPLNHTVGVYINGVRLLNVLDYTLSPNTVTLRSGPVGPPNVVEITTTEQPPINAGPAIGHSVDTSSWVLNGVNRTFPLSDGVGNALGPSSPADCLVHVDGTTQEPGVDYQIVTTNITFTVAPRADATVWLVVGIPLGGSTGARGIIDKLETKVAVLETTVESMQWRLAALEATLGARPYP